MQVILLERVENLGGLGDEVSVKNGFARNYLLPQGKALMANKANRMRFEAEREVLEKRNAEARDAASSAGESLDGAQFVLIRSSGATGVLYGSVSARDIVEAAGENGHKIKREQVRLNAPIKTLGIHEVGIRLHAEVRVDITVNVARSEDEAERQAAGENIIETMQAEQQAASEEQAAEMAEAAAELDTAPEGDDA
ncbi:50S ribosomal protein L9 [Hyphomonas sp. FCG-A18]|jgi:large subunit ribosomal protein L9|uniref:50S ribosomal protein L9 n=1 Tax=Hyphomonas sp. FCG-A18 TaxID=3080019 RepID=UPI002B2CABD2|nr:50S ribosomal protein L9 [Hyphomonas sp. FCG-A18]